jgi:hypothetical protein
VERTNNESNKSKRKKICSIHPDFALTVIALTPVAKAELISAGGVGGNVSTDWCGLLLPV